MLWLVVRVYDWAVDGKFRRTYIFYALTKKGSKLLTTLWRLCGAASVGGGREEEEGGGYYKTT